MAKQENDKSAPELTEEEQLAQMIAEEEAAKVREDAGNVELKIETFEDELPAHIEESKNDPDYAASEATLSGDPDETPAEEETPDEETPRGDGLPPKLEEPRVVTSPPTPAHPDAVETTQSGVKFGWQQPPAKPYARPVMCMHIGRVVAQKEVPNQNIGDQWVCTCGTEFAVVLNTGGKKVLKQQEPVVE